MLQSVVIVITRRQCLNKPERATIARHPKQFLLGGGGVGEHTRVCACPMPPNGPLWPTPLRSGGIFRQYARRSRMHRHVRAAAAQCRNVFPVPAAGLATASWPPGAHYTVSLLGQVDGSGRDESRARLFTFVGTVLRQANTREHTHIHTHTRGRVFLSVRGGVCRGRRLSTCAAAFASGKHGRTRTIVLTNLPRSDDIINGGDADVLRFVFNQHITIAVPVKELGSCVSVRERVCKSAFAKHHRGVSKLPSCSGATSKGSTRVHGF